MAVEVDAAKSPAPVTAHVFSLVLPVDGGHDGVKISFAASGYAFATGGASGYAVLSVNGKTNVTNLPSGTDQELVQQLEFEAGPTSECRISVIILVERGSGNAAYLNVSAIDAEILPRATQQTGRSRAGRGRALPRPVDGGALRYSQH